MLIYSRPGNTEGEYSFCILAQCGTFVCAVHTIQDAFMLCRLYQLLNKSALFYRMISTFHVSYRDHVPFLYSNTNKFLYPYPYTAVTASIQDKIATNIKLGAINASLTLTKANKSKGKKLRKNKSPVVRHLGNTCGLSVHASAGTTMLPANQR